MLLGAGVVLMVFYLLGSLLQGKKAMQNQWGGVTLDWMTPTPPPLENFDHAPKVTTEVYYYSTLDYKTLQTPAS
jgi:cytochrome c oxidase subunit I